MPKQSISPKTNTNNFPNGSHKNKDFSISCTKNTKTNSCQSPKSAKNKTEHQIKNISLVYF